MGSNPTGPANASQMLATAFPILFSAEVFREDRPFESPDVQTSGYYGFAETNKVIESLQISVASSDINAKHLVGPVLVWANPYSEFLVN